MRHIRVSISALSCYEQCPRKYKFQYIDKIKKTERQKHLDIGVYVHEVLEFFHQRAEGKSKPDEISAVMRETAKERWQNFSKLLDLDDQRKATGMLKSYLAYIANTGMPNVLVTEGRFKFDINPEITMVGVVDRIDDLEDGTKRILDYKTGKSKYLDRFQLEVYGLHLKNMFPSIESFVGAYVVLPEGPKLMEYTISTGELKETRESIIEQANDIMEDATWAPKPTKLCDWCEYKDMCPDALGKNPKIEELLQIGKRTTF